MANHSSVHDNVNTSLLTANESVLSTTKDSTDQQQENTCDYVLFPAHQQVVIVPEYATHMSAAANEGDESSDEGATPTTTTATSKSHRSSSKKLNSSKSGRRSSVHHHSRSRSQDNSSSLPLSSSPPPSSATKWSSGGLFDCFSDMTTMIHGFFCAPCCVPVYLSKMNGNSVSLNACHSDICSFRYQVREQYFISGSLCGDCIVNTFCLACGNAQVMREVKKRGPLSKQIGQ